jgi:hypothetical protein
MSPMLCFPAERFLSLMGPSSFIGVAPTA